MFVITPLAPAELATQEVLVVMLMWTPTPATSAVLLAPTKTTIQPVEPVLIYVMTILTKPVTAMAQEVAQPGPVLATALVPTGIQPMGNTMFGILSMVVMSRQQIVEP